MSEGDRHARASRLRWVRIGAMRVSDTAQREYKRAHAERIAANFDLEALGFPVVSCRDGYYWILDGQHRVAALKLCGFHEDDLIECECYDGLTEADEAHLFLRRDDRKRVGTFDRFKIALTAGHTEETAIKRIVERAGFKISQNGSEGSIGAVDALRFAYERAPATLGRTVSILGTAFVGDSSAFKSELIRGMALVCHRYDGALNDEKASRQLASMPGGTIRLTQRASALRLKTGRNRPECVAAAIVETLNQGRGGQKLESWWR